MTLQRLPSSPCAGRWLLIILLTALPWAARPAESFIEGTATYLERIALQPGALFEAFIVDISMADAPSQLLGQSTLPNPGNPPIHFRIPYTTGAVRPGHRYAIRATIRHEGKLLFTTDTIYPVLTATVEPEVTLTMKQVSPSPAVVH